MRYRYILSGGVLATDTIDGYRLLAAQKIKGHDTAIRIEIPDTIALEKYPCDAYSTWPILNSEDCSIASLNPKICIKINSKWTVLNDATKNWLEGDELDTAIDNSIKEKFRLTPMYTYGYVTDKQYKWYRDNRMYSWRFDKLPTSFDNISIPALTSPQIETLNFVRTEFLKYYESGIDDNFNILDEHKEEAKIWFANYIQTVSDDELALNWHLYSTRSLDPYKQFETCKLIEKMKKSPCYFVCDSHYKDAIADLIDIALPAFNIYRRINPKRVIKL